MPTVPKKPIIFISYAHEDEPENPVEGEVKWRTFVTGFLRPSMLHLHRSVDVWVDTLMRGGDLWDEAIEQKLRACDIFVLLVSPHSMSSDYILDKEVAIIRERQAKGEAVHFYPLVLTPTPKAGLDRVRDKNLRPPDGRPLSGYPRHEREQHMSEVTNEIAAMVEKITGRENSMVVDQTRTHARYAAPDSPRTQPILRLSTGESGPFFTTKGKMYGTERTYYIKVENLDDEKHITEVKLAILSIGPQNEYMGPWELESGFSLAAGDHKFIPLVQYGEANSEGYSSSAYSRSDSFFIILAKGGVGRQLLGPKAPPQTITMRATGIGTAPCDYACRIWVQDPEGRLRIADSDTRFDETQKPSKE